MSCIQLPYGKVIKNKKKLKLTNFPRNHNVLVLFLQLKYLDNINDSEFQREFVGTIKNNSNLQTHILASGEIGHLLQEGIDLQNTDGKLNDACVRNLLDPLYKNVL